MFQFLDDDHPEILKGMAWFLEVFIDLYRIWLLGIVPMFVDASVRLLGLYFPDILSSIVTGVAPCQIDTVLTPASGLLAYVEALRPDPSVNTLVFTMWVQHRASPLP